MKVIFSTLLLNFNLFASFLPIQGGAEHFEPSGLTIREGKLYTVNDNNDKGIYELEIQKNEVRAKKFLTLDLSAIKKWKKNNLDLEGITFCQNQFLLADERDRLIISLALNGKTEIFPIDQKQYLKTIPNLFSPASSNAGFEGIACNEEKGLLYVANERMFRRIFEISLRLHQVIDDLDVPSPTLPRFEGVLEVQPDFAGLQYDRGFVYALVRNEHRVVKIDVNQKKIIAEFSFENYGVTHYESKSPFGMVEGLALDQKFIYLVIDNNGLKRKNASDSRPGLVKLKRPANF